MKPARIDSIDALRGMVMVVMALDHTRDFMTDAHFDPTDLTRTTAALFMTRWVTHFCAPVFMFLAGAGAYLSASRGKSRGDLSRFLLTRGLWLVLLELTVVRCFGWFFNFDYHLVFLITLWAIGWSMVALAGLVFLPTRVVALVGCVMIVTHNLLDAVQPEALGRLGWLWKILHVPGMLEPITGVRLFVGYPLVPWIGVMAAGYGFGALLLSDAAARRRRLAGLGAGLTAAFVILRATNLYGDPRPWSTEASGTFTLFSFLNCVKYPPSLLYLLMTLGPAILILAFLDRGMGRWAGPVVIFGRVPMLYYLLHIPLLHALAVDLAWARYGRADWLFANPRFGESPPLPGLPPDYGYALPVIYGLWIGVTLLLFPVCRWFAEVKRRRRDAWLSYL